MRARTLQLWFSILALAACGGQPPAPAPVARPRSNGGELRSWTWQIDRSASLNQRREVVRRARENLAELEPKILAGLADPDGRGFDAAADMAGVLRLPSAAETLLAVACSPTAPRRAKALRTLLMIQSVPTSVLLTLLESGDAELHLEVLRALAQVDGIPFEAILPFLSSPDPRLAGAAAAVLPLDLTAQQVSAIVGLEFGNTAAGIAVVAGLDRRSVPEAVLTGWLGRLPRLEPQLQAAILCAVCGSKALGDPGPLRELALGNAPPPVRFEALRCLVAAKAAPADWLLSHAADLPRALRLLCGIGLLQLERREGAAMLFELAYGEGAEVEPAAGDDEAERKDEREVGRAGPDGKVEPEGEAEVVGESEQDGKAGPDGRAEPDGKVLAEPTAGGAKQPDVVAVLARQLLSRVADLPLHEGEAAFAAWCESPRIVHPEALFVGGGAAPMFAPAPR